MSPRPIIGVHTTTTPTQLDLTVQPKTTLLVGPQLERRIKQRRSQAYIQALTRLDVSPHAPNQQALEELVATIANEFGDLAIQQRPLGFVQKCILGPGFEVHILNVTGSRILHHYKVGEGMPDPFQAARQLAIYPSHAALNTYAFVEIYPDRLVPVFANGPVTTVDPNSLF